MTVKIHGKEYEEVKDRIPRFWSKYEGGAIRTNVVRVDGGSVVIMASLFANKDDDNPISTGSGDNDDDDEVTESVPKSNVSTAIPLVISVIAIPSCIIALSTKLRHRAISHSKN